MVDAIYHPADIVKAVKRPLLSLGKTRKPVRNKPSAKFAVDHEVAMVCLPHYIPLYKDGIIEIESRQETVLKGVLEVLLRAVQDSTLREVLSVASKLLGHVVLVEGCWKEVLI